MQVTFVLVAGAFGLGLWSGYALPLRAVWPLGGLAVIAGLGAGIVTGMGFGWFGDGALGLTVVPAVVVFVVGQGIGALKRREGSGF